MASAMEIVELELCPNCKKEIPQINYVMHTMHCARNISLCPICKEPCPKGELEAHKATHQKSPERKDTTAAGTQLGSKSTTTTWKSEPYQGPFPEKLGHTAGSNGVARTRLGQPSPSLPKVAQPSLELPNLGKLKLAEPKVVPKPMKPHNDLSPCKYCELELPKDTMKEHEDYCGTRTDKCNECGEFVMFKYKKLHEESNHGFIKLADEPGPKASWDSSTQRTNSYSSTSAGASRRSQYNSFDMSSSSLAGPAPQPPAYRRPNPPTELTIPCEFCHTPIPHEELIQHETGCRPDLARFNPRRRRQEEEFYRYTPSPPPAEPTSPEVELPCEFCSDMIPASQLLRHQATCN